MTTVGLVAPGSMGAAVGACLTATGTSVVWSSDGRGSSTRARAEAAGLRDAGTLRRLSAEVDIVLSVCPPHAAVETAEEIAAMGFDGIFVDANAVAPATCRTIARIVEPSARFVDGGIIGTPPTTPGRARLYLAGAGAKAVAALFDGSALEAVVLDENPPAASALKLANAAWTKGSSALLFAVRAYAAANGVDTDLEREWSSSRPGLFERVRDTAPGVSSKAWRWVSEMEEIAEAFGEVRLPPDLHVGAAEIFRRLSRFKDADGTSVNDVVGALLERPAPDGS